MTAKKVCLLHRLTILLQDSLPTPPRPRPVRPAVVSCTITKCASRSSPSFATAGEVVHTIDIRTLYAGPPPVILRTSLPPLRLPPLPLAFVTHLLQCKTSCSSPFTPSFPPLHSTSHAGSRGHKPLRSSRRCIGQRGTCVSPELSQIRELIQYRFLTPSSVVLVPQLVGCNIHVVSDGLVPVVGLEPSLMTSRVCRFQHIRMNSLNWIWRRARWRGSESAGSRTP